MHFFTEAEEPTRHFFTGLWNSPLGSRTASLPRELYLPGGSPPTEAQSLVTMMRWKGIGMLYFAGVSICGRR